MICSVILSFESQILIQASREKKAFKLKIIIAFDLTFNF